MARTRSMPRQNRPHVPQKTQRHHLHPNSKTNLRNLPSQTTLPQKRPRIPPRRHARRMGRHDIKTTRSRTKTTRHQTHPTIHRTNVGQHITTTHAHPTLALPQMQQHHSPPTSNSPTHPNAHDTPPNQKPCNQPKPKNKNPESQRVRGFFGFCVFCIWLFGLVEADAAGVAVGVVV